MRSCLPATSPSALPGSLRRLTRLSPANATSRVPAVRDGHLDAFREQCWAPERPGLLPKELFAEYPAMTRWFHLGLPRINRSYLSGFEGTPVPLELTRTTRDPGADEAHDVFHRFDGPLGQFLDWTERVRPGDVDRLYLAQARVADLPQPLQDDLPTPEIAKRAGRGDIYGASIWVGVAPTYTPLHRDPNPNLLLQLAGAKAVRLFEPSRGADVFAKVQRRLGRQDSAIFRGDEMMQGEQKRLLEEQVWKLDAAGGPAALGCLEARLGRGEGLFIPKGWWHSVKGVDQGVDQGVTASVNWWFR